MAEKLVKRITIWTIKYWGKTRDRLEKGLKELIIEGWENRLPMSIHFGDLRTVITFPVEEIAKIASSLRKHIGEFLPETI